MNLNSWFLIVQLSFEPEEDDVEEDGKIEANAIPHGQAAKKVFAYWAASWCPYPLLVAQELIHVSLKTVNLKT